ncbi:mitochondrial carnitine acylcarnitine carrier protein cacl [Moniliophthora roreri MCA 2997]|uniref:Mitochondrial carnitine acylcarnitine carrier protein cacl n=1 Tax=Moniliophthora roreri (strain MCA 2997) TaxID=1381753 RepID=V2WV39_MONRO|nr:mitochondrial carnitine acylcarnitine carrier protein cacl [Moniliophthora roreri MCA 2997]
MNEDGIHELNPTVDFIAGTVGGVAGLVVGFPFDTVKVRFQSPEFTHKYRSTFHAITTIAREERFLGLYRGITSPIATAALLNGLVFASYRFLLKFQLDSPTAAPTLSQIALAGAGCGIISSIITTPTELIKIRQQSLTTPTTARQVAWNILRKDGLRGLYRGMTSTALRDLGYGAYFWAYEATCRYFTSPRFPYVFTYSSETSVVVHELDHQDTSSSWPVLLIAGGIAGIAGWIFTFPMDVVKTRIQANDGCMYLPAPNTTAHNPSTSLIKPSTVVNPYRNTISTMVNSYRAEGMSVFFRGLAPTLLRAIPVNMATFAMFEAVAHALS